MYNKISTLLSFVLTNKVMEQISVFIVCFVYLVGAFQFYQFVDFTLLHMPTDYIYTCNM